MGTSCSESTLTKWVLTVAEGIWVKCKEELPECECYLKPGLDWEEAVESSLLRRERVLEKGMEGGGEWEYERVEAPHLIKMV